MIGERFCFDSAESFHRRHNSPFEAKSPGKNPPALKTALRGAPTGGGRGFLPVPAKGTLTGGSPSGASPKP